MYRLTKNGIAYRERTKEFRLGKVTLLMKRY